MTDRQTNMTPPPPPQYFTFIWNIFWVVLMTFNKVWILNRSLLWMLEIKWGSVLLFSLWSLLFVCKHNKINYFSGWKFKNERRKDALPQDFVHLRIGDQCSVDKPVWWGPIIECRFLLNGFWLILSLSPIWIQGVL